MLKLCLALPIFYPTFGGGSLRFLRYLPGLSKRDVQTRVLAGTARTKDTFHTDADLGWDAYPMGAMLPVEDVAGMPVHRVRLPRFTGVRRTTTYFRSLIAFCRAPETRPDVIQLHSFERLETLFWLWRLKRLGIPVVYAIQIARPIRRGSPPVRWLKRQMVRAFYNRFHGVVTSSEQIRDYLRSLGVQSPIAVIPNGVDLQVYRPADDAARSRAREALGLSGSGPVIMSVGAISPRKGSELLVEAWIRLLDRHPDAQLVLIGPRHDRNSHSLNDFEARLESLVQGSARPDQVHFPGLRDDVSELYAAADLVVLPTLREGGTPNVVLEAMACARPVLITPFQGQSRAIGRAGLEFEECARKPRALAESIADLLDDPDRRAALVDRALEWVDRNCDMEQSLDDFAAFYREAFEDQLGDAPDALRERAYPSAGADPVGARIR